MSRYLAPAGTIVLALVGIECAGWAYEVARRLLEQSARRLPDADRDRWCEEWLADLETYRERPLSAITFAVSVYFVSARRLARELDPLREWSLRQWLRFVWLRIRLFRGESRVRLLVFVALVKQDRNSRWRAICSVGLIAMQSYNLVSTLIDHPWKSVWLQVGMPVLSVVSTAYWVSLFVPVWRLVRQVSSDVLAGVYGNGDGPEASGK